MKRCIFILSICFLIPFVSVVSASSNEFPHVQIFIVTDSESVLVCNVDSEDPYSGMPNYIKPFFYGPAGENPIQNLMAGNVFEPMEMRELSVKSRLGMEKGILVLFSEFPVTVRIIKIERVDPVRVR